MESGKSYEANYVYDDFHVLYSWIMLKIHSTAFEILVKSQRKLIGTRWWKLLSYLKFNN